ncbi:hypothetical protein [Streptomyces narbonensis]
MLARGTDTFCSRACRAAARSSCAEPPDLTRYEEDLAATTEDLQLSATTLLAAVQGNEDTEVLMRQVTEHYRFLMDVEAAIVARGRARGLVDGDRGGRRVRSRELPQEVDPGQGQPSPRPRPRRTAEPARGDRPPRQRGPRLRCTPSSRPDPR